MVVILIYFFDGLLLCYFYSNKYFFVKIVEIMAIPETSNDSLVKEKNSFKENASKMWKYVSVEPMFIFFLIPAFLYYTAFENLPLEKVCYMCWC